MQEGVADVKEGVADVKEGVAGMHRDLKVKISMTSHSPMTYMGPIQLLSSDRKILLASFKPLFLLTDYVVTQRIAPSSTPSRMPNKPAISPMHMPE
jgi:hypothetical protein